MRNSVVHCLLFSVAMVWGTGCLLTDADCTASDASCNTAAAAAIAASFFPTVALPAVADISGLRVHMPLDGNANDSSGNNLSGTVVNGAFTGDRNGSTDAAYLVNQNDATAYIQINDSVFNSLNDLTVAFWVKFDALNAGLNTVLSVSGSGLDSGQLIGFNYEPNPPRLSYNFYNFGALALGNSTPSDLAWHHYAMSREGDIVRVYLDGVELTAGLSFSVSSGVVTGNTNGAVLGQELDTAGSQTSGGTCACNGGFDGAQALGGRLDEFRVYTRALTSLEVLALATNTP